ncbi:putative F-box protein-like [Capsicum annuum]|nr:putative F-box protein-like [Capsicum annuum]
MRQRNRENQKKETIPHTGGSKVYATRRAEIMVETGQWPGRAQMYIATHKNQDGVYVNEAAKEICEKIESVLSQSVIDESQVSPNDVVGKVLGPEHSGRVRCLGLGVVPSRVFKQDRPYFGGTRASSSGGSCLFQCRENFSQMMNSHNQIMSALKACMIMKEGTIPEQFVGLFDSTSMVSPTAVNKVPFTSFFEVIPSVLILILQLFHARALYCVQIPWLIFLL